MSHERRLGGIERRVSELDGGIECRACGYPTTDRSRGIQVVHRTVGIPDDFPSFPVCANCGNYVDTHGRHVTEFERIVLEHRDGDDDLEDGLVTARTSPTTRPTS